jgi:hypothetical protein
MNLMKYIKERKLFTLLVLFFVLAGVYIVQAVAADPGSDTDPIVTQSYVDAKINSLAAKLNEITGNSGSKYEVVSISAGKQLIAGGSTEIVLRQGKATAIASATGGLSDVTLGGDWQTGFNIPANHLLIVPKDDGRGLTAVTDIKILIRGTYIIK